MMRRILALCLTFHWMVVFALLSFFTIRGMGLEDVPVLAMIGLHVTGEIGGFGSRGLAAALAVMMSLAAALFLWAFLTVVADQDEEGQSSEDATRIAFAASIALVTFSLVVLAFVPLGGQMLSASVFCAALLVSYLAIATERNLAPEEAEATPAAPDVARFMAQDAGRIAGIRRSGIIYPFPERDR